MKTHLICRSFARVALLSLFIGLAACATQAAAKDDNMTKNHIPLPFHDLVGQLVAKIPTSLERVQRLLGISLSLENDSDRWQTYEPKHLVTADGIHLASITFLVWKPAQDQKSALERIFINFEPAPAPCIRMAKLRKEFGFTEEYLYDNPHKVGEGFYNKDFSYSFMIASRVPPDEACAASIVITTSDPTKP